MRRTVILGGDCKEQNSQAILAAVQFRMFHVLIYKNDIVPVILCGCEISYVMSREENRQRVCGTRVDRRIFDVSWR
jgi:hypothetical protein